MPLVRSNQPFPVCPSCNEILTYNATTCNRCGYRIEQLQAQRVQAESTYSQYSQADPMPVNWMQPRAVAQIATQPIPVPVMKKAPALTKETKRALIYFASVILVILVLVIAIFHDAGASLLSLVSHRATTPTKTYSLPKGKPLFADSFTSDASGWNLQSVPGSYAVSVGNGRLTLEDDKNSLLWELLPSEQTYSNFVLSVNAALSKGDQNNGYGVYIRGTSNSQSDLATYYRFELYGDGSYAIFKGTTGQSGALTEVRMTNYVINPVIQKQGKMNHVMIIAKAASMSFIVNGQLLTTIKDHSYASGSIALFVSNLPGAKPGAQAQFAQFIIYPA